LLECEHGYLVVPETGGLESLVRRLALVRHDAVATWTGRLTSEAIALADGLRVELVWLRPAPDTRPQRVRSVDTVDLLGAARPAAAVVAEILSPSHSFVSVTR
jgi:hypothetical protein